MLRSVFAPVSIVGLLGVTLLPLLCSAFAVYISRPGLLMAAAFCKAFLFGFIALGVSAIIDVQRYLLFAGYVFVCFAAPSGAVPSSRR